jgi:hypothetical protein
MAGVVFSQRVLLALVESGLSREEAYRIVQRHAHAPGIPRGGISMPPWRRIPRSAAD